MTRHIDADDLTDAQYRAYQTIRALCRLDARDGLGGGIAPHTLAAHTDHTVSQAGGYCQRLAKKGALVQVQGIRRDHETHANNGHKNIRVSYLPADHPDAPDRDDDGERVNPVVADGGQR